MHDTPAKKSKPLNILLTLMKYFLEPSSSTVYEAVVSLSICSLFSSDVVDNSGKTKEQRQNKPEG